MHGPARRASLPVLAALCVAACGGARAPAPPPNVLLITVDDLGAYLGCCGFEPARTPRIDRLAAGGVLFRSHYVERPRCSASRASLLTGLRLETTGMRSLRSVYRDALPEVVTLPQLFRQAGYDAFAVGKVEHGRGDLDDPLAWSRPPWRPERWQTWYADDEVRAEQDRLAADSDDTSLESPERLLAVELADAPAEELPDGRIATRAIQYLREERAEPFFLAVGFLKPHLPFVAPRECWELHPPESVMLQEPRGLPRGAPPWMQQLDFELRNFRDIPDEGLLGEERECQLTRGYHACVSHVDAQVGRVLDALDELGLRERTIVILLGDHGYHLGDQGTWGKSTMFERALSSPLVVRAPGEARAGAVCDGLVETVDVFPTLAELCGLEPPADLEGTSFAPLLREPTRPWKRAVYQSMRGALEPYGELELRGLRTPRWRYIETRALATGAVTRELYDLEGGRVERENVADEPEHAALVGELSGLLHAGWRAALPGGQPR